MSISKELRVREWYVLSYQCLLLNVTNRETEQLNDEFTPSACLAEPSFESMLLAKKSPRKREWISIVESCGVMADTDFTGAQDFASESKYEAHLHVV